MSCNWRRSIKNIRLPTGGKIEEEIRLRIFACRRVAVCFRMAQGSAIAKKQSLTEHPLSEIFMIGPWEHQQVLHGHHKDLVTYLRGGSNMK